MKTTEILSEIEKTGKATEQQILLLKRRMNDGEKIDVSYIWDNCPELTPEQNDKGIKFLLNLWKTPAGKERKNSPFGYREEDVLESFTHFELAGFYDCSKYGQNPFYLPLYNCCGTNGVFQYYYNGKLNIVG